MKGELPPALKRAGARTVHGSQTYSMRSKRLTDGRIQLERGERGGIRNKSHMLGLQLEKMLRSVDIFITNCNLAYDYDYYCC